MKKMQIAALVIVSAICLLNQQQTKAQEATSATVNLKVTLKDLLSLSVSGEGQQVALTLATLDDYTSGTEKTVNNQLLVSSTLPYNIKVKSDEFSFSGPETELSSDVNTDVVTVGLGSNTNLTGTKSVISLSATDQTILTDEPATLNKLLNVDYSINSTNANALFHNAKGDYTTTLTYTITND